MKIQNARDFTAKLKVLTITMYDENFNNFFCSPKHHWKKKLVTCLLGTSMFKRKMRLDVYFLCWSVPKVTHLIESIQELTPAEKEALKSMSLKEALERRKELARMKALQSYQEAKARRQNKIKSKT